MVSEGTPGSTPPPRTPLQEQAYQNMYRNQRTQVRIVDSKISRYSSSVHDFCQGQFTMFFLCFFYGRRSESINYRRLGILNARKPQIVRTGFGVSRF